MIKVQKILSQIRDMEKLINQFAIYVLNHLYSGTAKNANMESAHLAEIKSSLQQ